MAPVSHDILGVADKKIIDDSHRLPDRRGNGQLRREVWIDQATGKVTRYNLAYINHKLCGLDNGRVVGYDNAHGCHHRHFKGTVEFIDFVSFEEIEARFQRDWIALREEA